MSSDTGVEPSPLRETLEALHKQALDQGLTSTLDLIEESDPWWDADFPGFLALDFPAGREKRHVSISASRAPALLGVELGEIFFCGDLSAYADRSTGAIEAAVISSGRTPMSPVRAIDLSTLPGAEPINGTGPSAVGAADMGEADADSEWRLLLRKGDQELELSPITAIGQALLQSSPRAISLKMRGFDVSRHDGALASLVRYAGSLFFDMDLLYGLALSVAARRGAPLGRRRGQGRASHVMQFPLNDYSADALSLYRYGRASGGLPLLEFLSYYQALEYFFPAFAHEETSRNLRTYLLHPRFNPDDDAAISRIINLSAPAVQAGVGERAQLRATVRAAVTDAALREVLTRVDPKDELFTSKKQRVKGATILSFHSGDVRDHVAERIYAIRCRIVHTKQDGGGASEDLLLPSSREASQLGPDIAVLRFIAQQAIVARAKRAP